MNDHELAELVATKVMGWKKFKAMTTCFYLGDPIETDDGEGEWGTIKRTDEWNPCNDWNDMRLVIEKGNFNRLILNPEGYYAEFISEGEKIELHGVFDEKAGRAVCIAALKAKGVEV